jgi:hypothetical protein
MADCSTTALLRGHGRPAGRPYHHLPSSIVYLRFFHQSGGKGLKLSITALLFVTTGVLYQLV